MTMRMAVMILATMELSGVPGSFQPSTCRESGLLVAVAVAQRVMGVVGVK
jgi:hypothetical protein